MQKYRFKILLIVASVALAVYFLIPTYQDYRLHKDLLSRTGADSLAFLNDNEQAIRDARGRRIKLGLDLQGGMRVVLEVNVLKLIEDLAKNKDDVFGQIMAAGPRTGQDLRRVSGPPPPPRLRGAPDPA